MKERDRIARRRASRKVKPAWKCRRTDKIRYLSKEAAEAAAELQGGKHDKTMRAYYCKFCGGFHLTSKPYEPNLDAQRRER